MLSRLASESMANRSAALAASPPWKATASARSAPARRVGGARTRGSPTVAASSIRCRPAARENRNHYHNSCPVAQCLPHVVQEEVAVNPLDGPELGDVTGGAADPLEEGTTLPDRPCDLGPGSGRLGWGR